MKKIPVLLITLFTFAGAVVSQSASAQEDYYTNSDYNTFYNRLAPYGRWVNMPRYGSVWVYNEPGFRPYSTNGQWVETDMGWAWQSGYEWGDIPFHYGRWELDRYYGWIWIPGYDYAPAWVMWSEADDYFGWAPLGYGMDINISIGRIPSNRWMYAERDYMGRSMIGNYCVPYQRTNFYYERQRPVENVYTHSNVRYFGGPRYNNSNNDGRGYGNPSRPPVRQEQYTNRDRGSYGNPSRPPVRQEQYGNNNTGSQRVNGSGNNNNNNIHFDPSMYDRNRAIAGGQRPEPVRPPAQQERPASEQRRIESNNRPVNPILQQREISRPAPGVAENDGRNNQAQRVFTPAERNTNSQPQRVYAPVERSRTNSDPGGRPMITGDRRIH